MEEVIEIIKNILPILCGLGFEYIIPIKTPNKTVQIECSLKNNKPRINVKIIAVKQQ